MSAVHSETERGCASAYTEPSALKLMPEQGSSLCTKDTPQVHVCVASKLTASLLFRGLVFSTRRHTFTRPAPSVVITSFLQGCTARQRMRSRWGFAIYIENNLHSHLREQTPVPVAPATIALQRQLVRAGGRRPALQREQPVVVHAQRL